MDTRPNKRPRRRVKNEIRIGLGDSRTRTPILWELGDPYYWLMEIRWPAFVGTVVLIFLVMNLVFGIVYAELPGSVANAAPGSFADGFFFSIDTLATVGYGNMYPASRLGHAVASAEILLGLFFMATVTGLIFARFARPRTGLVFSRHAVVGRYEGKAALMVRAAWTRSYPLIDATAQLSWLETITPSEGQSIRRFRELELVRNHNPLLGLSWTLVHILPEDSGILAAIQSDELFLLTASISGTDMLLNSPSQSLRRYWRDDVQLDHEFAEMIFQEEDALRLDFTRLNEIHPISGGSASA